MKKLIINPDIHGRGFWKSSMNDVENSDIIFLGDYLDPYPMEYISPEEAIDNFLEIIDWKKKYPNNITLLLGNHDFMTYIYPEMGDCRTDFNNLNRIKSIYQETHDLFQIMTIREINDKKYSFSHAAILKNWVESCLCGVENLEDLKSRLNSMYLNNDPNLPKILNYASWIRGGWENFGSIVWADVREFKTPQYPEFYQIFGHTQLKSELIESDFACLDCRKSFIIDNNIIHEYIN